MFCFLLPPNRTPCTVREDLLDAREWVYVGHCISVEYTIIVDPSGERGGISFWHKKTGGHKWGGRQAETTGLDMLLEEHLEGFAVLLRAIVLLADMSLRLISWKMSAGRRSR